MSDLDFPPDHHAPPQAALLLGAARTLRLGGWEVTLPDGCVTWSDQVCDVHRLARGTRVDLERALGFYAPEWRAGIAAAFEACVRDGAPYDLELEILVGGARIWVRTTGQAERGADGRVTRVYGALQDVSGKKQAEQALAHSEQRFRELADAMPHLVWTADAAGYLNFVNRAVAEYTGLSRSEACGEGWLRILHPADREGTIAAWADALAKRTVFSVTYRILRAAGQCYRWCQATALPAMGENDAIVWYGSTTDIDDSKTANEHLRLTRRAIEACANPIAIVRAEAPHRVDYLNSAFTRLTGVATADAERAGLATLWREDREQPGLAELRAALDEQRTGRGVIRIERRDGCTLWLDVYLSPVPSPDGRVSHFVAAMYDITAARQYQAELEYQSHYDTLTTLANRNLLRDRADQAIKHAAGSGRLVWIAYINLDRFKAINDALGHEAGDQVLRSAAARMQAALRATDTAARIAADEFVVLLNEQPDRHSVAAQVRAIRDCVAQPMRVRGRDVFVTCSIGIAASPSDSDSAETLISQAKLARYRATRAGAGYGFYTAAMNDGAMERLQLETDLRQALERAELEVFYQPQVDARDGRIVGAEALLRWHHPRLGLVPPGRFIPIAEETGLIAPIGAWVMRSACLQARAWQDAGHHPIRLAVNLSARQFYQPDLALEVAAVLDEAGLAAEWLEIELTEGLAIDSVEQAVDIMRSLKAVGVKLSIDDFGTGYSSLSHLKNFPVDVLKVDQSFVRNIVNDPGEATIARTIIALGHGLGLQVIAEGVETEAQLGFLLRHGCDLIQGFYFSRPVPAAQFERLLEQGGFHAPGQAAADAAQQTLLIVDDEAGVTAALECLLRGTGCRILAARTAQEGFALLAQHGVQVVLCDQLMAGMTGTEFLSQVKQLYPDTIRMMLSGQTKVDGLIEATNSGAVFRFHTKPWDGAALRKSIDDAFRYYWSSRQAG